MSKHKAKKRLKWCKHIKVMPGFFDPEKLYWTVTKKDVYVHFSDEWKFCPYCGSPRPKGKL